MPPVSPAAYIPPAVSDFEGELLGDQVLLSWTLSVSDQSRWLADGVIRIFRAGRPVMANDDCPDCPPAYIQVAEVPIRKMRTSDAGRMEGRYQQAVKPDFQYWYYVVVRSADGVHGPPSEAVKIFLREDR